MASNFIGTVVGVFLTFFYTNVIGLYAVEVGKLLLIEDIDPAIVLKHMVNMILA